MYKYRHKNRLLANLYDRLSLCPSVHPHDRLPPPVARGPRSLGALQRRRRRKQSPTHTHTQKTIIKRFVCLRRRRKIDSSNKRAWNRGLRGARCA